jgi:hypothetical protein
VRPGVLVFGGGDFGQDTLDKIIYAVYVLLVRDVRIVIMA